MIVRLIAVDPRPLKDRSDLLVYQVPENSREMKLLQELFDIAGIEHAVVSGPQKIKKRVTDE
jgi:hypothetical protein